MPSGKIRAMAGGTTDGKVVLSDGVDIREPLLPLYPQNSGNNDPPGVVQDHGKSHIVSNPSKSPRLYRPNVFGSSRSVSSRSGSPDVEEQNAAHHQLGGGATRDSAGDRPHRKANPRNYPAMEERTRTESSEIQILEDTASSPMSMSEGSQSQQSHCFSDSQLITDVEDNENLMQLKLEAMTWAAMAKDFTISSLEKRLRKALQIAKAEQAKNHELQTAFKESRQRQNALALELSEAKEEICKLVEAEERLCQQLGEFEAEALEQDAQHRHQEAELEQKFRDQVYHLENRIRVQDQCIQSLTQLDYGSGEWGQDRDSVRLLEQELGKVQDSERDLNKKYYEAGQEIDELKRLLNDMNTDLRVSEVLRKTQSRRLKVLEKERRYLLRKGAIRSVKLAPRNNQRKSEPTAPGGPGWNVFSVVEFADETLQQQSRD